MFHKEYKTKYDWMGKVIHKELCKRPKFSHVDKWYMQKPEIIFENETNKILGNNKIQKDHLIPSRKPDLVLIYKKMNYYRVNFAVSMGRICLCFPPDRTWHKWLEGRIIVGVRERKGRTRTEAWALLVSILGLSDHLVQMWAGEPGWTWDPNMSPVTDASYSLNWTTGSCAIQKFQ